MMSKLRGQSMRHLMGSCCLIQVGEVMMRQEGSGTNEFRKEKQILGRLEGHLWRNCFEQRWEFDHCQEHHLRDVRSRLIRSLDRVIL